MGHIKISKIFLLLSLLIIASVNAAEVNTFNNSADNYNVSLNGYAYFNIYKHVNVTNAVFNVSNKYDLNISASNTSIFNFDSYLVGVANYSINNSAFIIYNNMPTAVNGGIVVTYNFTPNVTASDYFIKLNFTLYCYTENFLNDDCLNNQYQIDIINQTGGGTVVTTLFTKINTAQNSTMYVIDNTTSNLTLNNGYLYRLRIRMLSAAGTANTNLTTYIYLHDNAVQLYRTTNPYNLTGYLNGTLVFNTTAQLNYSYASNNFSSTLQSYLNNCTADSNYLCTVPLYFNTTNSSTSANVNNLNITLNYNGGLLTRVQDVNTLALINGSTLIISNSTTQQTLTLNYSANDSIFLKYDAIPTGNVTLRYSATGYETAVYYANVNETYLLNLTAFLLNSSGSNNIFVRMYALTSLGGSIADATISIYQPINLTYVLVGQYTTDGSGMAAGTFDSTLTYLISVDATGYKQLNQTKQFTSSDLYLYMTIEGGITVNIPSTEIYWSMLPWQITNEIQTFSFNTSTNGSSLIEYQNLTLLNISNGVVLNTTGNTSAKGANLSLTYNISKLTGDIVLIGTIKPINQSDELNYYIPYDLSTANNTITASSNTPVQKLKETLRNSEAPPEVKAMFVFIILIMVLWFFRVRGVGENQLLILMVMLTAFSAYLELISWNFFILALIVTFAVIVNRSEL